MVNLKIIRTLVFGETGIYFNSIEEQLDYFEKNKFKSQLSNAIYSFGTFLLWFSIIPIIPLFVTDAEWLISRHIVLFGKYVPANNFFVCWVGCVTISWTIYAITHLFNFYFQKKFKKFSIKEEEIAFAYIYKSYINLDKHLINGRSSNATNSSKFLIRYLDMRFLNPTHSILDKTKWESIPEMLDALKKENSWIAFSATTEKIFTALKKKKLINEIIINQPTSKYTIKEILESFVIYEYLRVKAVNSEEWVLIIGEAEPVLNALLEDIATKIIDLQEKEFSTSQERENSVISRTKKLYYKIPSLFTHNNLAVAFLSWLIFLTLILIFFGYIGIKALNLKIDTTLYVGLISSIIAGSIAITVAIYSKKK